MGEEGKVWRRRGLDFSYVGADGYSWVQLLLAWITLEDGHWGEGVISWGVFFLE